MRRPQVNNVGLRIYESELSTMKVCLVAWDYPTPYSKAGSGIGSVTYTLAHELHRLGCQVHVVVLYADGMPSDFVDNGVIVHQVAYGNIHYYLSRLPVTRRQGSFLQFVRYLEIVWAIDQRIIRLKESDDLDIVEIPPARNPFWKMHRSLQNLPYIAWLHGSPYLFKKMLGKKVNIVDYVQEKLDQDFMRHARVVIAPSAFLGGYYRERVGLHVRVVPSPAPTIYFECRNKQTTAARARVSNRLIVFAASPLSWAKGVDTIVDAIPQVVQRIPNVHFVLAGKDDTYSRSTLRAHFQKIGLERHITFPGHIPWLQMSAVHSQSDLFVTATRWENSPLSVIEAMAASRPVVGTDVGGVPELVVDDETGVLVSPNDPAVLAAAISDLLQNSSYRERLGKNARERISHLHHPRRIAEQRLDLYATALDQSG